MEFNGALGVCPNCQAKPLSIWRRMIDRQWPLPLTIGLALQTLSQRAGPVQGGPTAKLPEVALIGQFITGTLVFAAVAALLLLALDRIRTALRRKTGLRHWRNARRR